MVFAYMYMISKAIGRLFMEKMVAKLEERHKETQHITRT